MMLDITTLPALNIGFSSSELAGPTRAFAMFNYDFTMFQ